MDVRGGMYAVPDVCLCENNCNRFWGVLEY